MTQKRRYGAAFAAVALLLGLVGCNAKSMSSSNAAAGGQSPVPLSENQFAASLTSAQAQARSAHVDATINAAGQSARLSADVSGLSSMRDVAMRMSLHSSQQNVQLVLLNQSVYIKGLGFGTSPGKPWLKVDLSSHNNPMSQLLTSANPAKYIAYLKGITTFRDKGVKTVDGVQTRHYTITVDTAKMLTHNPAFDKQTMSGMAGIGLPKQLTSQVYVDAQDRPVLMSIRMGSIVSIQAHFSKYGQPVQISAPPAGQVNSFSL